MQTKPPSKNLLKEVSLLLPFSILFLIVSLSGVIPYIFDIKQTTWAHWNTLGHTLLGVLILVPSVLYIVHHYKRTLSTRRYLVILSGIILILVLLYLFTTGLHISIVGQQEKYRWVYDAHVLAGFITFSLIVIHIFLFFVKKKTQAKATQANIFNVVDSKILLKSGIGLGLYALAIMALTLAYNLLYKNDYYTEASAGKNYELPYGENPFLPSQNITDNNQFIASKHIANSRECGSCHQDIFKQWTASIHSQAASDPTYVKNVNLLESNKGIAATRYCEGCHAPVAIMSGELSIGGKHGGVKNTPAHNEGVGCMSCHGIESETHLRGVASYSFNPEAGYLFANSDKAVPTKIHNFLLKINPKQHRQLMSRDILKSPKLCATCHEQFMDESMNNWGWVKMQNTYTTWLDSHYSGQSKQTFSDSEEQTCQSCHFGLTDANDPSADINGKVHSHRSLGANTAIPWVNNDMEQLELVSRFLQSNRVLISIDNPQREDNTQGSGFVDESIRNTTETPYFLYLGEKATIQLTVANNSVGHNFPAGTTDLSQAWVYFKVSDANNKLIYESGAINQTGFLDKSAHVYKTVPVDRSGKEVWKHNLFEMVGDTYKKLIPPNKSDIVTYSFDVPYWAQGPITVSTAVKYRKFNQRYAEWALDTKNPTLPVTEMSRDTLSIPIRKKPLIE